MLALDVLPAWVPSDELVVAFAALVVAILVMNRGVPWFVNLLAQDEPVLVALGVFLVVAAGWFAETVGLGAEMLWWAAGLLAIALGVVARYTNLVDIEGLV